LGRCRLLVDTKLMDVQAGHFELLDLQAPHDRSTDRQTADRQGAESARPDGRRPNRGRPDTSRLELRQSTLPLSRAEHWEATRKLPATAHELVLL